MKKIALFLTILSLGACKPFDLPEGSTNSVDVASKTMDQLNVPANFTFNTTQEIDINLSTNGNDGKRLKNIPFKLYVVLKNSTDSVFLMSAFTNTEGVFQSKLALSSNAERLVVTTDYLGLPNYETADILSDNVELSLGGQNLKRTGLVSDDGTRPSGTGGGGSSVNATFSYMGSYNSLGVPLYLVPNGDNVSQDILEMVNASLPEGRPVPTYNPEYIASGVKTSVSLKDSAAVWVTYITEGAGYRNALGYYAYPTNNPPQTAADIAQLKVVFPNVSFIGSGGGLKTGDKVLLGNFPAGTTISWFLVPDGWTPYFNVVREQNSSLPIHYSTSSFNTFTTSSYRNHVAVLADPNRELVLLGFEDLNRPGGDNDFNDAVFYVTANPFSAIETGNLATTKIAEPDTDGDGVPDSKDVAPNDPLYSSLSYGPGQNQYGTLAFEDAFPSKGDYDMNDVVVDYNFEERLNAANKIRQISATLVLKAMGASYRNGFGIELPVAPNKVSSVTGMKIRDNIVTLSANGTEAGQTKTVIIPFDNGYKLMSTPGGRFVNTEKDVAPVAYDTIRVLITFTEGIDRATLGNAPYNPFIFVNRERGREVHLPGTTPTSLATLSLFKTEDDDTGNGKYYQTKTRLPWAININSTFNYPIEKQPVNAAFLKFNEWAESGGTLFTDWYQNKSNYRATEKIY